MKSSELSFPITCTDTGEVCESHEQYLLSHHWKNVKKTYYKQHPKQCVICQSEKRIILHHNSYENIGHEEDKDLVSLCGSCHQKNYSGKVAPQDAPTAKKRYSASISLDPKVGAILDFMCSSTRQNRSNMIAHLIMLYVGRRSDDRGDWTESHKQLRAYVDEIMNDDLKRT